MLFKHVFSGFPGDKAPTQEMVLQTELTQEVAEYRAATYSANTKKSYQTHLKSYFEFCSKLQRPPVPASQELIALYAAFLARRLKPSSVRQYLNIVRILHLESNYPNPLQDNWYVKSTLTGIDRLLASPVKRAAPVTPQLLIDIKAKLDFLTLWDSMFWAAALLMFFATLRKSNLFPNTPDSFSTDKQFTRSDLKSNSDGTILVSVKYSKTDQFKQHPYNIKLMYFHHPLSPVVAINHAFKLCPLPPLSPAFVVDHMGTPMSGVQFNDYFKSLVRGVGLNSDLYSSHSFRRGSATWALQCGIPGEVVQQMGNWKSNCYQSYVDQLPQCVHDYYRNRFNSFLPR